MKYFGIPFDAFGVHFVSFAFAAACLVWKALTNSFAASRSDPVNV